MARSNFCGDIKEATRDDPLLNGGIAADTVIPLDSVVDEVRARGPPDGDLAAVVRIGAGEDDNLRRAPASGHNSVLECWKKADTDL